MPIVCQCVALACSGDAHCPIKRIAAQTANLEGQKLNPRDRGQWFLLLRSYFGKTSAEYQEKHGIPAPQRCGRCLPTIKQEFINDYDEKSCLEGQHPHP